MDPKNPSFFPSQLENNPICNYGSELVEKRREKENLVFWDSMECSSTPGRPLLMFVSRKKSVPSKWVDAEKWLFSRVSSNNSNSNDNVCNQKKKIEEVFPEKSRVLVDCKIESSVSSLDVPLKDKFTDEVGQLNPNPKEPTKEAFFLKSQNLQSETMKDVYTEVVKMKHRDIRTDEMHPAPLMSTSPARHNTPTSGSQSVLIHDITKQLKECNLQFGLAQFDPEGSPWSSWEDEEDEMSKSLRHYQMGRRSVSVSGPRACAWELQEEKSKFCLRYQREEAKIQAWVDLQTAKAEAQSKKFEVKIQKMRSELEEKLMKRMGIVHRKSEEWRTLAKIQHSNQIRKVSLSDKLQSFF